MGRTGDMKGFGVAAALLTGGCAVLGGGSQDPAGGTGSPESPVVAESGDARPEVPVSTMDTASLSPAGALAERMLAGDYEGVLESYAADSTLHANPAATYHAALAAAMSGHPAHDRRRARRLFERLLEEHPGTPRRFEVELYLDLLARETDLRAAIERLDRELQQLKAIDLGQAPDEER